MANEVRKTASGMARAGGGQVRLPTNLRMFWVGSVAVFGLMILVAYIEKRMGFSRWHYNPLTGDRYQDLMEFWPAYGPVHAAAFFGATEDSHVAYPPFGAAIYALVYGTGHPVMFYLGTAALWLTGAVWSVRKALLAQGIGGMTAMLFPLTVALVSFPVAGLLQRGNIELFLWILMATGTWAFFYGHEDGAAVLWGMAAAMKMYPVLLLALLLPRRRWRPLAVGTASAVGTTLLSAAWLGPNVMVALRGALRNTFGYQGVRASQWTLHELMANHTVFDLAKLGAMIGHVPLAELTLPYYVCGAVFLATAFFGKLWKMPAANQLLAVTAFMVGFPPVSYYYTLVQLYAPWLVLVFVAIRAERAGVEVRGLRLTMALFLPLFGSFMLLSFPRVDLFGGLVQAVLLVWLFLCALVYPFGNIGPDAGGNGGRGHADLKKDSGSAEAHARGRVWLPVELRTFWAASLAVLVLTFVVGWLKWRAGQTWYNWDPLSDPLYGDLMEYPGTYQLLHTAAFFFNVAGRAWPYPFYSAVAYPPLGAAVMAPIYAFRVPEVIYLVVSGAWLLALVTWTARVLMRAGIGTATAVVMPVSLALISFPIERMVHQGNVEVVVWMCTAGGVLAFWRGRNGWAGVLWGLAAAMKLFPVVLLVLLLPRRAWRALAAGVGAFVGSTLWALWWLGPTVKVAWYGSLQNVFGYEGQREAEFSLRELVANHSLIDIAKSVGLFAHLPPSRVTLPYFALGAVVMGAAFFGKLWKMPAANQVLAVSTFMVMFPPISYYHALVHMIAPLVILGSIAIEAQRRGVKVKGLGGTMLLFVPLFAPFTVLTYPQVFVYCGLVQGGVLAVIFLRAVELPLKIELAKA